MVKIVVLSRVALGGGERCVISRCNQVIDPQRAHGCCGVFLSAFDSDWLGVALFFVFVSKPFRRYEYVMDIVLIITAQIISRVSVTFRLLGL